MSKNGQKITKNDKNDQKLPKNNQKIKFITGSTKEMGLHEVFPGWARSMHPEGGREYAQST